MPDLPRLPASPPGPLDESSRSATAIISLRSLRPGDIGWIVHRHGVIYAEEQGWSIDFEAMVAGILSGFQRAFDAATDGAWVAERSGRIEGSIFLARGDEPRVGKLRLLYVEPAARGRGVGTSLIDACIARARAIGYERLDLWTASALVDARRRYQDAGFELVDEQPMPAFGKDDLVTQTWSLAL